jgi:hypothetical protein
MRTISLTGALAGAATALLLASAAHAQSGRFFIEHLPLPPAEGYNIDRVLNLDRFETGENWVETTMSNYGVPNGSSEDAANFAYARFPLVGRPGQIYATSGWDYNGTPIDQPSQGGDDCAHSHHVGALYWYLNAPRFLGYYLIGSHGAVGMRTDDSGNERPYGRPGICAVTSRLSARDTIMNQFRWVTQGHEEGYVVNVDPTYTKELVVVAQSATHGTGACPSFQCYPPVWFLVAQIQ